MPDTDLLNPDGGDWTPASLKFEEPEVPQASIGEAFSSAFNAAGTTRNYDFNASNFQAANEKNLALARQLTGDQSFQPLKSLGSYNRIISQIDGKATYDDPAESGPDSAFSTSAIQHAAGMQTDDEADYNSFVTQNQKLQALKAKYPQLKDYNEVLQQSRQDARTTEQQDQDVSSRSHGWTALAHGVGGFAGDFVDPRNLAFVAATGGLDGILDAAGLGLKSVVKDAAGNVVKDAAGDVVRGAMNLSTFAKAAAAQGTLMGAYNVATDYAPGGTQDQRTEAGLQNDGSNPALDFGEGFLMGAGGTAAHAAGSLAFDAIKGTSGYKALSAGVRSTVARVFGGTDTDAVIQQTLPAIRSFESGGNDTAQNPRSSAYGPYQYLDKSWRDDVLKYYPDLANGKTEDQLLAMRSDPEVSGMVKTAALKNDAGVLKRNNIDVTPGNLYLFHLLGEGRAKAVLRADPGAPLSDVLPSHVIDANHGIMAGRSAGELQGEAEKLMSDHGSGHSVGVSNDHLVQAVDEIQPVMTPAESGAVEHMRYESIKDDMDATPDEVGRANAAQTLLENGKEIDDPEVTAALTAPDKASNPFESDLQEAKPDTARDPSKAVTAQPDEAPRTVQQGDAKVSYQPTEDGAFKLTDHTYPDSGAGRGDMRGLLRNVAASADRRGMEVRAELPSKRGGTEPSQKARLPFEREGYEYAGLNERGVPEMRRAATERPVEQGAAPVELPKAAVTEKQISESQKSALARYEKMMKDRAGGEEKLTPEQLELLDKEDADGNPVDHRTELADFADDEELRKAMGTCSIG